eukprot:SAG31_NODE_23247_length_508_cov_0.755501_1_plen_55_part_01
MLCRKVRELIRIRRRRRAAAARGRRVPRARARARVMAMDGPIHGWTIASKFSDHR